MPYQVAIRRNADGVARVHNVPNFDWDEDAAWMWTEGNYSCDCNRALFFAWAAGDDAPEDRECTDGLFTAVYAELPDGTPVVVDLET